MVRYTQDSWKNDAPSIQANLWGDDPFPAVDSNWDQPSKSFVASAEPDHRQQRRPTRCSSRTRPTRSRSRAAASNPELNDARSTPLIPPVFRVQRQAVRRRDAAIRCSGAARATRRSGTRRRSATTRTCSSSRTTTRAVFGKHFVKAGVLVSCNKKNEDIDGNGSQRALRVLGRRPASTAGASTPATSSPTSCSRT